MQAPADHIRLTSQAEPPPSAPNGTGGAGPFLFTIPLYNTPLPGETFLIHLSANHVRQLRRPYSSTA